MARVALRDNDGPFRPRIESFRIALGQKRAGLPLETARRGRAPWYRRYAPASRAGLGGMTTGYGLHKAIHSLTRGAYDHCLVQDLSLIALRSRTVTYLARAYRPCFPWRAAARSLACRSGELDAEPRLPRWASAAACAPACNRSRRSAAAASVGLSASAWR